MLADMAPPFEMALYMQRSSFVGRHNKLAQEAAMSWGVAALSPTAETFG